MILGGMEREAGGNRSSLALHHGFDPVTFSAQCRAQDGGAVVLPGPARASGLSRRKIKSSFCAVALARAAGIERALG